MDYSLIREAGIEDATAIVGMIRAGSDEGVFHSRCDSLEEQVEGFRRYAFESRPEGYEILVYHTENRIEGYVDYQVRRGVGHILGIYVKRSYRRRGVGKRLMDRALEDFNKLDVTKQDLKSSLIILEQSTSTNNLVSTKRVISIRTKKR